MAKKEPQKQVADNLFDKVAWYALLGTAFLAPLLISTIPLPGTAQGGLWFGADIYQGLKYYVFGIGVSVALISWSLSVLLKKREVRYSVALIPLALYVCWALLSVFLSDYSRVAFFGWEFQKDGALAALVYALFAFLVIQYVKDRRSLRTLLSVVCAASALVSLYGVLQSLGFDFMHNALTFNARRASSTLGNPDALGGFLCLASFVSLSLALSEKDLTYKVLYWGGFVLNCWCLAATFTRGAWLGFVVGLLIFVVAAAIKRIKLSTVDWAGAGISILVAAVVVIASFSNPISDLNAKAKVAEAASSQSSNVAARFGFWRSASEAIKDAPLVGHGLDTYPTISSKYTTPDLASVLAPGVYVDTPHNYYLQIALGTGLMGLALLLCFYIYTAVVTGKAIFAAGSSRDNTLLLGLWCACAAFLAYALTGVTTLGVLYLFWTLLGVLLAKKAKSVSLSKAVWAKPVLVICIAAGAAGVLLFAQMTYLDARFGSALSRMSASGQLASEEAIQGGPSKNVSFPMTIADIFVAYGDSNAEAYATSGNADENALATATGDYEKALRYYSGIIDEYPFYSAAYRGAASVCNSLAELAEDTTYATEALGISQRALKFNPNDVAMLLEEARAYVNLGEKGEAVDVLDKAKDLQPDDEQVRGLEQQLQNTGAPQ